MYRYIIVCRPVPTKLPSLCFVYIGYVSAMCRVGDIDKMHMKWIDIYLRHQEHFN